MNKTESVFLKLLDDKIYHPAAARVIDEIAGRVEEQLRADTKSLMAWEPVPLDVYGSMPDLIRSSWVFILRANADTGAERHPNSHQRAMSYRGFGAFRIMENDVWIPYTIVDQPGKPIDERWVSIPVNGWHHPIAGPENWVIVSFHTVPADELIEERMVGDDPSKTHQQLYL
ncbi:hypothetical protein HUU42_00915 [bacterium]|nr:hypothetical protein [bacterium]